MDPNFDALLRTLHIVANILWVGGVVGISLLVASAPEGAQRGAAAAGRRLMLTLVTPSMLVAWIVGLTVLVYGWGGEMGYAKQGWMHGKLTLGLIVTGLTGALSGRLRKGAADAAHAKPGLLRGLSIAIAVLALLVVVLAKFQFGR